MGWKSVSASTSDAVFFRTVSASSFPPPETVKIEVSPVLRGTVFEPELRPVSPAVEDRSGFAEMKVVSLADLYAGKKYDGEFRGMTVDELPLAALLQARERLIEEVRSRARAVSARRFLTSFHRLEPDWTAIGFGPELGDLPAVRWKLLNLERLRAENGDKYDEQLSRLADSLS